MAVHMFRVLVGPQSSWSQVDVNAAVEDWMNKQSEWTADSTAHSMAGVVSPVDGTPYWQGDYRLTFDSEPKANLYQKLEDKLVNKPDWYRVGYHECEHDETDPTPCAFTDIREWTDKDVTIPSEVPL